MKVTTVGGTGGRRRKVGAFPGPQPPRQLNIKSIAHQAPPDRNLKTMEDIMSSDRYSAWQSSHGGSYYEFLVFDYLQYEKHLTEADFHWRAAVHGIPVDFHIPGRSLAWNLEGKQTIPVPVQEAALRNSGLSVVRIPLQALSTNATKTLDHAWMGQ